MGLASILVKRSFDDVAVVTPAVNRFAFKGYVRFRISKSGYLWGGVRISLIDGEVGKIKEENLGLIGQGFMIESVSDDQLILKKKRKNRILKPEFNRNKEGSWV